jgi:hypothetical protein
MTRYLFIVSHEHPELFSHLSSEFSGEEEVEVILDRRREERRRRGDEVSSDRRLGDRRTHPPVDQTLRTLNFALVRAD